MAPKRGRRLERQNSGARRIVPTVLVHGGAWSIPDNKASRHPAPGASWQLERAWRCCSRAVRLWMPSRQPSDPEDDPVFDAGKGSCLTKDGVVECDAMIQRWDTLDAGAVACVSSTRNPISLARTVLEKSDHVFLVGKGADAFGKQQGLHPESQDYFVTPAARQEFEEYLKYGDTVESLFAAESPSPGGGGTTRWGAWRLTLRVF